jgi:glutamyl-tRNA synthetase
VNQSNARFDEKKLAHMNMAYLLELPLDAFVGKAREYFTRHNTFAAGWPDDAYLREVLAICQPKIKGIEELPAYMAYFFTEDFPVDAKAREKVFKKGDPLARLRELAALLAAADFSSDTGLEEAIKALAEKNGFGFGDYQAIARLAVSGTNVGPSLTAMFRVMGRERVLARIERFLARG